MTDITNRKNVDDKTCTKRRIATLIINLTFVFHGDILQKLKLSPVGGKMKKICVITSALLLIISCKTAMKDSSYLQKPIPSGSNVGIIIDAPNSLKNVVIAKFMSKGYNVKAINASDIYTLSNHFDVNDFKKIAYRDSFPVLRQEENLPATDAQKVYDSIFKLHVYNYELSKADTLRQIREKWDVKYLLILEMANWEKYSWGRAIDLSSLDVMWVDNRSTRYNDSVESLTDHVIASISGK